MVTESDLIRAINNSGNGDGEAVGLQRRDRTKRLCYWKWRVNPLSSDIRKRDGWITVGPHLSPLTAMEFAEFQQIKQADPFNGTSLPDYGNYHDGEIFKGNTRFNPLIESGGIKEFPRSQIVAYGWHKLPAVVAARPDLDFDDVPSLLCQYGCISRQTGRPREFTSEEARAKHVSVMHKDAAGPDAIGRAIDKAIKEVSGNAPAPVGIDYVALGKAIAFAITETSKTNEAPGKGKT